MNLQPLLIFILAILTVTFVAVGTYFVLVLKEFRETIKRSNKILDDVEDVTNVVAHPLNLVTSLFNGIQAIKKFHKEE
jgi:hypothetical protein